MMYLKWLYKFPISHVDPYPVYKHPISRHDLDGHVSGPS